MKIFLFGYGQMGREIESVALERGHEIIYRSDPFTASPFDESKLKESDIAIEFSTPFTAYQNILECFKAGIPVVVGTTGWNDSLAEIKDECSKYNGSLFHSPNFSIGVNIFFRINEFLAKIINLQPGYDIKISETHHTRKKDAPSGTAINIAKGIIKNIDRKHNWVLVEKDTKFQNGELPVYSYRTGDVVGDHEVEYISSDDKITISHKAFNRKGLAVGTLIATEWLPGHKGVFTMDDLLLI